MRSSELAGEILGSGVVIDGCTFAEGDFPGYDALVWKEVVDAICMTIPHSGEGFLPTVSALGGIWRAARAPGSRLQVVLTSGDVASAKADGKLGLILTLQHWDPIANSLGAMHALHRLGLRVAQLAYNDMSHAAAGCLEPDFGLTRFGRLAVSEMNRLGIVVDLSHCSDRTCLEAAEASEHPVVLTHANPYALGPNPRNRSDEAIRAVAASGGTIGLSPWGPISWLGPGHPQPALKDYVDKICYVANMVGTEHISFGTDTSLDGSLDAAGTQLQADFYAPVVADYDREIGRELPVRYAKGFSSPNGLHAVCQALLDRGFSRGDLEGFFGLNLMAVFSKVLG